MGVALEEAAFVALAEALVDFELVLVADVELVFVEVALVLVDVADALADWLAAELDVDDDPHAVSAKPSTAAHATIVHVRSKLDFAVVTIPFM